MEREKIVWEFEQLYHSLKEHEYRLLARLEELDLAIYNSINGAITQFSCNISHLSGLIAQLEEKQQQPTRELLQVRLAAPPRARRKVSLPPLPRISRTPSSPVSPSSLGLSEGTQASQKLRPTPLGSGSCVVAQKEQREHLTPRPVLRQGVWSHTKLLTSAGFSDLICP